MKRNIVLALSLSVIGAMFLPLTAIQAESVGGSPPPLAEWSFDEGAGTRVHDVLGNNVGIFINSPSWVTGKIGTALDFKEDSWVQVSSQPSINNLSTFTIVAWINARKGGRIITKGDTRPVRFYIGISPKSSGSLDFGVGYDGVLGEWRTATGTVSSNTWHQVAVTYAYGQQPAIYIDGVPQSAILVSLPTGNPQPDNSSLYIGSRGDNTANFDGQIDDIQLYGQILPPDLIQAIYQTNTAPRPNIVVIMTDDQDDQGSLDTMPQVQSLLLNQGVHFINSFVTNPLCCSSRASFLTGQYSHNNGVWQNARNTNGYDGGYGALAPTDGNTLPVWLQQAGYRTGLIGKYLNQYGIDVPQTYVPPGWNTWNGLVDPTTYAYYNYTINENGILHPYGSAPSDYQTDVLTQKALTFIDASAASSQPFFLWLTPLAPHAAPPDYNTPTPSPKYTGYFSNLALPQWSSLNESDMSDKPSFMQKLPSMDSTLMALAADNYRKQREALLSVDDMVAAVVAELQKTGKLSNTYIIFTSDNGFFHGQHRLPIEKRLVYEESVRVPLIIRGPGIPIGETRNQMVANIDLTPTILDIAKASPGRSLNGRSLTSLLPGYPTTWRLALLLEGTDKIPFDTTFYSAYSAIRTDRFKYVEHYLPMGTTETEFYDLKTDPDELLSRSTDPAYSAVIHSLKTELSSLQPCRGSTCWVTDSSWTLAGTPAAGSMVSP
ncbi:MAG: hypothetical protein A3J37_05340, partial [Alphaproteobacteria bacterium RIFCSPHIGHO2_12_FULL_45_9]